MVWPASLTQWIVQMSSVAFFPFIPFYSPYSMAPIVNSVPSWGGDAPWTMQAAVMTPMGHAVLPVPPSFLLFSSFFSFHLHPPHSLLSSFAPSDARQDASRTKDQVVFIFLSIVFSPTKDGQNGCQSVVSNPKKKISPQNAQTQTQKPMP